MLLINNEIDNDYFFVAKRLISLLKAPVKFDPYLLWYHPGYPGLLSIKDTLLSMGFSVEAFNISDRDPSALRTPALIQLQSPDGDCELVIVKKVVRGKVMIEAFRSGNVSLPADEVRKVWDGNLLTIDYHDNDRMASEMISQKLLRSIRTMLYVLLILLVLAAISAVRVETVSFSDWRLTLTSGAGLLVSIFLLMKQLKLDPVKFLDRFCEHDNFSCSSVLDFKDARLPFGLMWSEAAVIYFSGLFVTWIGSCLFGEAGKFALVTSWLSLLTLPVIAYAIYLQMCIIKNWCSLCLLMHVLLIVNILVTAKYWFDPWNIRILSYIPVYLSVFLVMALAWYNLKLLLSQNFAVLAFKERTAAFRSNTEYFDYVLESESARVDMFLTPDMQWGRLDATIRVLGILSFDCKYCYTIARDLIRLRDIFADDLMLEIIFVSKDARTPDPFLVDIIAKSGDPDVLMKRWLESEGLSFGKRRSTTVDETIRNVLHDRGEWLVANGIKGTPRVFINGVPIAEGLSPMDFMYYLRKKINYDEEKDLVANPVVVDPGLC